MRIDVKDLHRITVQPGDVFVYRPQSTLTNYQVGQLIRGWEQAFPENRLLVLPGMGGELFAVRTATEPRISLTGRDLEQAVERDAEQAIRAAANEAARNGRLM